MKQSGRGHEGEGVSVCGVISMCIGGGGGEGGCMFKRLQGSGSSLRLGSGNDCNRERRGLVTAAQGGR